MNNLRSILLMLVLSASNLSACAGEPTDQLRASTDKILGLLRAPASAPGQSERRQLIRQELDQRIDWDTVSRSSLGKHWARLKPEEQADFVATFSRFLVENVLDKFATNDVSRLKLDYVGEKIIDDYASVKVQVTTKDDVVHPIEYRLHKSGQEWRGYDVLIEGVSLVKNYRDQFDEILAKSSHEKLLADLRSKIPQASP